MDQITAPMVVICPSKGLGFSNLKELWEYRELLYILIWRDLKVRYKQTAIGAAWAVIQPFLAMVIFSVFFGHLARISSEGIPYPIFAYSALLLWQFFSKALTEASTSLVVNERLITKAYFPRLLVPSAAVLGGLVDFALALIILVGMMAYYGIAVSPTILTIPFFLLVAIVTALGVSFWLSALDVMYRDVRYTLPFLTQIWFFATPVVYPSSLVPEEWRAFYGLNPMVGVVEGFRWALLGISSPPSLSMLAVSTVSAAAILLAGSAYFRYIERTLADHI